MFETYALNCIGNKLLMINIFFLISRVYKGGEVYRDPREKEELM